MGGEKHDDLSSFRIADLKRPEVRSFNRQKASAQDPKAASLGFPAIESRLERLDVEGVAAELRTSYEKLEALAGKNPKTKQAAKKAMAAYERTADLFEYLFATKSALAGTVGTERK